MLVSKLKPNIATVHSAWGLSLYSAELLLLAYISTFNWEFQAFPTQVSINSHDAPVATGFKEGVRGLGLPSWITQAVVVSAFHALASNICPRHLAPD
jgi:hypothetical protein